MPTTGCGDPTGLATLSLIWVTSEAVSSAQTLDYLRRQSCRCRMQSGVKTLSAGGGASLCCLLLLWLIYSHLLREGQLAVGTCEIVMLNRDNSVPRRTIARQTARCACRRGQIAGTTRARPACVDARIVRSRQWCEMTPCLEGELCSLLFNRSGWTCTKGSGRIKTVTEEAGVPRENPWQPRD